MSDYLIIEAVSPYYMWQPTHPCAWFIDKLGPVGKSENPPRKSRLMIGAFLCLRDTSVAVNMLDGEEPMNFCHIMKVIGHELMSFTGTFLKGALSMAPLLSKIAPSSS
jgi:hypothetical protein